MKKSDSDDALSKFNSISKGTNITISIIFALIAFLCIIPVILVLSISLSSESAIKEFGYQFIPKEFSFYAYSYLMRSKDTILKAFLMSTLVTVLGTIVGLFFNTTMGYVLSRNNFKLKKFFTTVIFIPMLFSGGMISTYMMVSTFLNLKDTIWALTLPMACSSFYIIILRTFFQTTVPDAIVESAKIDGASQLKIFVEIVLPISLPAIATIGLFLSFAYWNDWQNALFYIDNPSLYPLQYLLTKIENDLKFLQENAAMIGANSAEVSAGLPTETVKMAIVMIVILPIACIYPFFQRYFISGLTIGAVKG